MDSTEAETHAALVHDCQPWESCSFRVWSYDSRKTTRRVAQRPKRTSTETVRSLRQRAADKPPTDSGVDIGEAEEVRETEDGRLRVRVGKHWYRTLDATAGVRAYTGSRGARRFWHGFYCLKAIDHFTGAPVALGFYSASRQECRLYPEFFPRIQAALDGNPQTVIADKGFSVESVFKLNTSEGVASVIPWRRSNHVDRRRDKMTHDRHGIPRCKHCGGEGRFVRFRANDPTPRLWFRCLRGTTKACQRDQSIACAKDWRLLIPLWRLDPVYHELEQSHALYERNHRHWRDRYRVAGDSLACRPKRRGQPCHELRGQAALLVEWLRISYREGWLEPGSKRRNGNHVKPMNGIGVKCVKKLSEYRAREGLTLPYGPQAEALGVGLPQPPSERVFPLIDPLLEDTSPEAEVTF